MRFGVKFISIIIAALPTISFAAEVGQLKPSWSNPSDAASDANGSYLSDRDHHDEPFFLSTLVDDHRTAQLKQDFEDLNRDYDRRAAYGLSNRADQQAHVDQVNGFGRGAAGQVQRYQLDRTANDLKAAAQQNPDIAKPVAVVGGAAAVASGSAVKLKLDDNLLLQSRTYVARQRGEFNLFSNFVNASVQVNMLVPSTQDPTTQVSPDPMARDERYRFSLTRNLPLLDLSSAFSYGSTSSSLNASLSKKLTNNLTAVVDSSRLPDRNAGTVKLNYGFSF